MYQMQKRNIMSIKKKLSGQNVLQVVSLLLNISHVIHCPIHILISLHNKNKYLLSVTNTYIIAIQI